VKPSFLRPLAAALLLGSLSAPLPALAQDIPIYPAEVFYEVPSFSLGGSQAAITTDGRRLLITSDETGIFNVYEVDLESGERRALTRSRTDAAYAIGWLGDNRSFLYTSDQGGNELNHVYLRLPDGRDVDLTPGAKTKASFLSFTPDRRAFFLATNERDPAAFDVYRYDAVSLDREMVFQNDMKLGSLTMSDRGDRLAGVLEKGAADNDIYVADLAYEGALAKAGFTRAKEAGEPRLVTEHEGDIEHALYTFDPSGNNLVIGSNEDSEFTEAFIVSLGKERRLSIPLGSKRSFEVPLGGGKRSDFVTDSWDVQSVSFSPSGSFHVQSVNADGRTVTQIIDRRRNRPVVLPARLPEGAISQVRFLPGERSAAITLSSSKSPADLYVVQLDDRDGDVQRLTNALEGRIDEEHLVRAEVVRYPSFDGLQIPAIQYRPHGVDEDDRVPAVVLVHGGPGGQSRATYSAMVQHLVNNGYGVLAVNNRGSSGYGKSFYHMDDRRHGEVDLKDVVAARAYLEGRDWVEGDKIAVMGGSYGGFMTMAALAFEPEVFDAGINIFGVTNWERTLSSIPAWWGSFRERLYGEMGDPATDQERHRRISPLFYADQVTKPVLIVQGANDPRVLQIESDEMVAELRANDVPVEYVLFDDEGHGFQKRDNRIEASEAYVRFLDRHLLGDGRR
jgi:dipeptidyl aminopeptidase/acylaminoacyl peptidase